MSRELENWLIQRGGKKKKNLHFGYQRHYVWREENCEFSFLEVQIIWVQGEIQQGEKSVFLGLQKTQQPVEGETIHSNLPAPSPLLCADPLDHYSISLSGLSPWSSSCLHSIAGSTLIVPNSAPLPLGLLCIPPQCISVLRQPAADMSLFSSGMVGNDWINYFTICC